MVQGKILTGTNAEQGLTMGEVNMLITLANHWKRVITSTFEEIIKLRLNFSTAIKKQFTFQIIHAKLSLYIFE